MTKLFNLPGYGRLRPRGMWFHVDIIIGYSAGFFIRVLSIRTSLRDGGTAPRPHHHVHHPACLVPKFDAGYVREHSPLPVPFRAYCSVLSFDLVVHFDVLFTVAPSTGIPVCILVGLMGTGEETLSSGLMLVTFLTPHLSQFYFADTVHSSIQVACSLCFPMEFWERSCG